MGGYPWKHEKERASDTEKGRKLVTTTGHWSLILLKNSGNSVAHEPLKHQLPAGLVEDVACLKLALSWEGTANLPSHRSSWKKRCRYL